MGEVKKTKKRFKVGDLIVGKKGSCDDYRYTNHDALMEVKKIKNNGLVEVKVLKHAWADCKVGQRYDVDPNCFEKVGVRKDNFVYAGPVDKIIFSGPYTTVIWSDGSKTQVKAHDEDFDKEKGLAMCFVRKFTSNKDFATLLKYCNKDE